MPETEFTLERTLEALRQGRSFPYLRRDAEWLLRELVHHHPGRIPVVVSGSTSFAYEEREVMLDCCAGLGELVESRPSFLLLTGGMTGVAQRTSEHFARDVETNRLYHVLPVEAHQIMGIPVPALGLTHYLGTSLFERQIILGLATRLLVVIGGGPGTAREANTSLAEGAVVLPLGVTGGVAAGLRFNREDERDAAIDFCMARRRAVNEAGVLTDSQWEQLISSRSTPESIIHLLDDLFDSVAPLA